MGHALPLESFGESEMAKFSPAISSLKICDVDKMFFSECTSDPSISEIRNKDYFFPKKNIHHRNTKSEKRRLCNLGEICTYLKITFFPKKTSIIAIQSLKNVDCAILEKFVLFKGKNQRILVAVFFKRIISVNLEENLKNKISDLDFLI